MFWLRNKKNNFWYALLTKGLIYSILAIQMKLDMLERTQDFGADFPQKIDVKYNLQRIKMG